MHSQVQKQLHRPFKILLHQVKILLFDTFVSISETFTIKIYFKANRIKPCKKRNTNTALSAATPETSTLASTDIALYGNSGDLSIRLLGLKPPCKKFKLFISAAILLQSFRGPARKK